MPPRFLARVRKTKIQPKAPSIPHTAGMPHAVAPSSQQTTTRAQQRRGLSEENRARLIQTARVATVGAAAAGTAVAVGYGAREIFEGVAAAREANRARLEIANVPFDANGDGVPDGAMNVPFVLGSDGGFSSYGAGPSHTQEAPKSGTAEFGDAAKTVGLVVGGLVVVVGVVYVATRPEILKKLGGALR